MRDDSANQDLTVSLTAASLCRSGISVSVVKIAEHYELDIIKKKETNKFLNMQSRDQHRFTQKVLILRMFMNLKFQGCQKGSVGKDHFTED